MDLSKRLGLSESKHIVRKAAELRRLCDVHFDSSIIGVGEVCKAVICLEIAATKFQTPFDRQTAVKKASADFTRPVVTAVAFYLCAKKHKLKVDKIKLIELWGSSESEFASVSASMKDLCYDVFGVAKEKKDPRQVKGNRELLDVLPEKRKFEDGGYSSDDGEEEDSSYKKHKKTKKADYEEWRSTVLSSNKSKLKSASKPLKLHSTFLRKLPSRRSWRLCKII